MYNIDKWIEKLHNFKPLTESEAKSLINLVLFWFDLS